jgi:hypothetical protein
MGCNGFQVRRHCAKTAHFCLYNKPTKDKVSLSLAILLYDSFIVISTSLNSGRSQGCPCAVFWPIMSILRPIRRTAFLVGIPLLPMLVQRICDFCQPCPVFDLLQQFRRGKEFDTMGWSGNLGGVQRCAVRSHLKLERATLAVNPLCLLIRKSGEWRLSSLATD